MAKIYFDRDADLSILKGKVLAVIGYGNQGRAQAKAMRGMGLKVIVGNIKDESWFRAKKDGFKVYEIRDAVKRADCVLLLVPDEVAPEVYYEEVEPFLKDGALLDFASGYNLTYHFIEPRADLDVVMVAPRMIGAGIEELVGKGVGYPSLIGVAQDRSGSALKYALAIAKGIGSLLPGGFAVESSFEEETLVDLFSEHGWAGALLFILKESYDLLVEAGVSPEVAILELYASGELIEVAKAICRKGLFRQLKLHSRTSQYGQLTWGPKYGEAVRPILREALKGIKDGSFATEWALELKAGLPKFKRLLELTEGFEISKSEDSLYRTMGRR